MEIFLIIALGIVILAVAKWCRGRDKPIEFDTPNLRRDVRNSKKAYVVSQKQLRIFIQNQVMECRDIEVVGMLLV